MPLPDQLRAEIEGDEFALNMSLANSPSLLLRNLSRSSVVRAVKIVAREDTFVQIDIVNRIANLYDLRTDDRYESPYDIAVSAYLLIVALVDSEFLSAACDIVRHDQRDRFWWAPLVSETLQSSAHKRYQSHAASSDIILDIGHVSVDSHNNSDLSNISGILRVTGAAGHVRNVTITESANVSVGITEVVTKPGPRELQIVA